MITIKNLKPGWAIAENSSEDAFAYDPEKFHLLNPNKNGEELVSVFLLNKDTGIIDYDLEGKLPSKELTPKASKIEFI